MTAASIASTSNYQVPVDGTTHAVKNTYNGSQSSDQDWARFSNDNFQFTPQGAFIDNTDGGIMTLLFNPIGLTRTVPAGGTMWIAFPAPDNMVVTVTTVSGTANIFWVNYPVIESTNGGALAATITSIVPINMAAVTLTETFKTAPAASALLLNANATRKSLIIMNNDISADIYVSITNPAVVGEGIKIAANGGYWEPNKIPNNALYFIGSVAGTVGAITVEEGN